MNPGDDISARRVQKLLEIEDFYEECTRLVRLAREAEERGDSSECQMYIAMQMALEAPGEFDFKFEVPGPTWN